MNLRVQSQPIPKELRARLDHLCLLYSRAPASRPSQVAGLRLLRDITQEAPELQLIQIEILIKKTSRSAWNLIHEVLDDRWQECHPDVNLIRK
jgi:hypothetical protein